MLFCFFIGVFSVEYTLKSAYGRNWLLIFNHDLVNGQYFTDLNQTMLNFEVSRYSLFGLLNQKFKTSGYYEFLLEYPEIVGCNQWRQSLLPWEDTEVIGKQAIGYTPINISWTNNFWGGLVKSNNHYTQVYNSLTLLDGSAGNDYWYYSIGCVRPSTNWSPDIPGPSSRVKKAKLWLRLDNKYLLNLQSLPPSFSKKYCILLLTSLLWLSKGDM